MSYILVVLQVTAIYSGTVTSGWASLGEFSSHESCVEASKQLVAANSDHLRGISKFVCLKK